jgi:hypothetical protein
LAGVASLATVSAEYLFEPPQATSSVPAPEAASPKNARRERSRFVVAIE